MANIKKNPSRFLKKWCARSHAVLSTAAGLGFPYSETGRPLGELSVDELGAEADQRCALLPSMMNWAFDEYLLTKDIQYSDLVDDGKLLFYQLKQGHIIENINV